MKLHVAVPTEFDAVHVTVLTPIGKLNGEVIGTSPSMHVTEGVGRPDAATVKFTRAEDWPTSLVAVMSPGQDVKTGGMPESTWKLKIERAGLFVGLYSGRTFWPYELIPTAVTVSVRPSGVTSRTLMLNVSGL